MQTLENILSYLVFGLSLIGVYLLILAYQKKHEIEHTLSKGKMAEGTVVELRENPTNVDGGGKEYTPVVEFRTDHGLYRHHSSTYKFPTPYHLGQKVKIYYYIYKSRYEFALEDDEPGTLPDRLKWWGIIFCIFGLPLLLYKISKLI
ncbi:MAG: DUF3592 domain-containing protein [Saprospiraceae bacterium]|nr:DUF3592 domain-containing protein [Saprospiraceae bacterium]